MGGTRLTLTMIEKASLPAKGSAWLWDASTPGLGVRILASGSRSYVYRYGSGRRGVSRRVTLGQHGAITLEQARQLARKMIGARADGRDPAGERARARGVPTLREFSAEYLAQHSDRHKRPASAAVDRELFELHLLPAFGSRPLDKITREDVARWHRRKHETPTRANHCLALLSHVYTIAQRWGILEGAVNPARGVVRYQLPKRERYLSLDELQRVGVELAKSDSASAAALRVLILTGARRSEVLGLRWDAVDLRAGVAKLATRKRGPLLLVLPAAACAVLAEIEPGHVGPWCFPGRGKGPLAGDSLSHAWEVIRARAGLADVRVHDLRHSFASVLAGRGVSLPIIGGLLGHSQPATTARYAHLADGPLRVAADGAADAISAVLGKG